MNQYKNDTANIAAIKKGLLICAVVIIFFIAIRLIDPLLQFTNIFIGVLSFFIVIALLVVMSLEIKKSFHNNWSFVVAFRVLFIMIVLITTATILYNFILFKFLDPGLPIKINDAMLSSLTNKLSNSGIGETKTENLLRPFQNGAFEAKFQPTLKNESISFISGLIMYSICGLIIAAFIKKRVKMQGAE